MAKKSKIQKKSPIVKGAAKDFSLKKYFAGQKAKASKKAPKPAGGKKVRNSFAKVPKGLRKTRGY